MINYHLEKKLLKLKSILIDILLFIPRCIITPIYYLYNFIHTKQVKKTCSDKALNKYIKYLDDYHVDNHHGEIMVLEKSFYNEFTDYISIPDFFKPWGRTRIRNKITNIYYNDSDRAVSAVIEYYKNRILLGSQPHYIVAEYDGNHNMLGFKDGKTNKNVSKLLTEEELKEYFTNSSGDVSYWYSNLKGKNVVMF